MLVPANVTCQLGTTNAITADNSYKIKKVNIHRTAAE